MKKSINKDFNALSDRIMNVDLKIIEPETKNIEYKIVNLYGETVLEESVNHKQDCICQADLYL